MRQPESTLTSGMNRYCMKVIDQVMVPIVTGGCLVLLVAVLKNVLMVPQEVLSQDFITYVIIYIGYITAYSARDDDKRRFRYDTPVFWSILIVIITVGIIAIYALA